MTRRVRPTPIRTWSRRGRLLPSVFSIVPEGAVRRRPSDLVRCGFATAVVAVLVWASGEALGIEQATYDWLAELPSGLDWLFRLGYVVAMPLTLAAIAVAVVVARRWRFAAALGASGAVAGVAYVVLDHVVGSGHADALTTAGSALVDGVPDFPPGTMTVAAAALFAAAPYLTRPARAVVRTVVLFGALSAMVLLEGLPVSVLAGLVVAWAAASAVRFVLGTPAGTPSVTEVRQALEAMGLPCRELRLAADQVWGESRFVAELDATRLLVTVFGRDATDARLAARLVRSAFYKDPGPRLVWSRADQVEHRAYLLLVAERAGTRAPDVVAAGVAGDLGHAVLVTVDPRGVPLAATDPDEVTDELLVEIWRQVTSLHDAHIAHGALGPDTVVVSPDGSPTLVDFGRATASATPEQMRLDDAQLLAGTAAIVGVERAVAAAAGALGDDGLGEVLPLLQPAALARQSWRGTLTARQRRELLAAVREGASGYLGTEMPQIAELKRVSWGNLLMAIGAIVGVYLLIGQLSSVGDLSEVFSGAAVGWVVATFVVSQMPQIAQAVAMLGSVAVKLPLGPVIGVQFANNFTGLVGGTVATTALVVRFFQKQGQVAAVAISSGVINTLGAMVTQAILLGLGLWFTASDYDTSSLGGGGDAGVLVLAVVAIGGISGIVLLVPRLRRQVSARIKPQFVSARDNLVDLARTPRKSVQLFGGNLASQLLFALTLSAALHAYGASLPLLQLVVINTFASLIGGVAPVPGGMGVIEAGLIGGFTAAGVPSETAIAATMTARMFTAYLPPIWGWASLRWLQTHDYV